MVKPYSFLLYLLGMVSSFFMGVGYAGLMEAGKGQGLAAAAIVLGYGVVVAGIGLIIALFVAYKTNRTTIFRLNMVLALLIVGLLVFFYGKFLERQKEHAQTNQSIEQTNEAPDLASNAPIMRWQYMKAKETGIYP